MSEVNEEDVVRLRMALGRISRLMDRQVSGDGMTRTQLSILATIARRGPIGLSELADIEGVNPTMLSRMIGKLTDRGLVQRTRDEQDRRAARVEVTASGSELHERLRAERSRLLAERLDHISAADGAALLHALPALESLGDAMCRRADRQPDRQPIRQPIRQGAGA